MSAPVETKVTAATTASIISTAVLWVLSTYVFDGAVPDPLVLLIGLIVTGGVTFFAGYRAKHTPRPDLRVETR